MTKRGGFDFSKPPRYHWGVKRCLLHDGFFLLPSCGRLQNIYLIFAPIGVPLTAQYAVWRNRSHRDHVSQQQWFFLVGSAL
jgi:hypothetical protein